MSNGLQIVHGNVNSAGVQVGAGFSFQHTPLPGGQGTRYTITFDPAFAPPHPTVVLQGGVALATLDALTATGFIADVGFTPNTTSSSVGFIAMGQPA